MRKSALTSHVQAPIEEKDYPKINMLIDYLEQLEKKGKLWNINIPKMIKAYFADMELIFIQLQRILKKGGKVYLNVSNSAYGGLECEVDTILSQIAINLGFELIEVRIARYINSSNQQTLLGKLRESVLVLQKQ